MASYRPLDLSGVRTLPIGARAHRVRIADFGTRPRADASFAEFMNALPRILKGNDIRAVVRALADSVRADVVEEPIITGREAELAALPKRNVAKTPSSFDRSVEPPFGARMVFLVVGDARTQLPRLSAAGLGRPILIDIP